jgi:hypothetical protein
VEHESAFDRDAAADADGLAAGRARVGEVVLVVRLVALAGGELADGLVERGGDQAGVVRVEAGEAGYRAME